MSDSRERILQRLRAARSDHAKRSAAPRDDALFADYPASREQRLEHFAAKLVSLNAECLRARDTQEAAAQLKSLLQSSKGAEGAHAHMALHHAGDLLDQVFLKDAWLGRHSRLVQPGISNSEFEKFAAGVTTAEFLIARTGSIVLLAKNSGGRRLSVLPPFHIVVAGIEQIVDSLDEAFAALGSRGQSETSYMTVISGPSRTSDIEKTLVLGAHGPKRLAIILIG
jgi:L-lactate dehydrogenase complex protein LldG